jgi:hypothetical protein
MLSRSADFLEGFSMVGRLAGGTGAGGTAFGAGAFRGSGLDNFFFGRFGFFVLAMGVEGLGAEILVL